MSVLIVDPICGMRVDPARAADVLERGGERHYFCSSACAKRFDETSYQTANADAELDDDGVDAEEVDAEEAARRREYRRLIGKFWASAAVSVPVVALSYPQLFPGLRGASWLAPGSDGRLWVWRGLGVLTLPILIWAASQFYVGLWAAAKSRSANMHTLIAVGISAAWLYSTVAVLFPSIFPRD